MPFCDSTCGAPALMSLGTSVQGAYAQQQSQLQSLGNEIGTANNDLLTFSQNYVNGITNDTFDRLTALDAATTRIESSWIQLIKAKENFSDFKVTEWNSAIKKYFNASQVAKHSKQFSDLSQPTTGDLGACSSAEIKRGNYRSQHVSGEIVSVQKRYLEEIRKGDTAIAIAIKNETDFVKSSPLNVMHDKSIPNDLLINLQGLFAYMVNPSPTPNIDNEGSVRDDKDELEYRERNIALTWISSIAATVLAKRAVFDDLQCESSYVSKSSNDAGNSLHELWSSKIEGRITSEGYWGASKQLLPSGLHRELTYLKAEENMLLYERYKMRERRNELLAYLVAIKAREER